MAVSYQGGPPKSNVANVPPPPMAGALQQALAGGQQQAPSPAAPRASAPRARAPQQQNVTQQLANPQQILGQPGGGGLAGLVGSSAWGYQPQQQYDPYGSLAGSQLMQNYNTSVLGQLGQESQERQAGLLNPGAWDLAQQFTGIYGGLEAGEQQGARQSAMLDTILAAMYGPGQQAVPGGINIDGRQAVSYGQQPPQAYQTPEGAYSLRRFV